MAYTTINKGSDYFNTITWTGDASYPRSITGVGFQPDWIWLKNRTNTYNHVLMDIIRGTGNLKWLSSNLTDAEGTQFNNANVTSLDSDGFTIGSTGGTDILNGSSQNIVAWNWLAGGTGVSNTDGDITSTVSANTTSGFSIVSWTGDGVNGASVGHGLSQAPEMIVVKNRTDGSTNWRVGQTVAGNTMTDGNGYYMEWDDTKASTNPGSATIWGSPPLAPTSSVFYVGSNNANNGSGDNMICYCFHSVKGYSKIGSYSGNGSTDGTFIYTGFAPAFVMIKRTNSTSPWTMFDNKRGQNENNVVLEADASTAEQTPINRQIDILSNGFKNRATSNNTNAS